MLFHLLVGHFFCWEVSIWVFHPIFHWVICIFKLSGRNFFLYSDYTIPLSINVLQYFLPAKKDKPKKKKKTTNLSTNPWRVIKCFYIFIYLIFFIYKIFWTEQRKKSWALTWESFRGSLLWHAVTVNPEQVSTMWWILSGQSISSLFLIFILVPGKVF